MEQKYLPLHRKYRPQAFKDIVGQENLVKALTNAIELNRIANAYLFCGPRGTGKTSSARIFAKSLNCEHGPTTEPCQKCASCVDITNAVGLDVIEIDAASNRGIQDAKELINQAQYVSVGGKYKIFIIDEVHMLSNDAFNALLKTFEEPPKNVIFILATTEPHKVLETIVSRCQRFDLKRITTDDIVKRLREISDLENIKITQDALFTIAKNVSGGLRDSLALLDQVSILGIKEEITTSMIEELIGKINFDVLINLLNDILKADVENTIKDIEEIYAKGNEPRNLAENLIEFLKNVILVLNSNNDEAIHKLTGFIGENIEKIRNLKIDDKDKINKILNILIDYYKEIKISTDPYLWMELAAIAALRIDLKNVNEKKIEYKKEIKSVEIQKEQMPKQETQVSEIKQIVQKTETTNPIRNVEPVGEHQKVIADETEPKADNNLKDSSEIWREVLSNISSLPARAFYSGVAKLVGIKDKTIILGFLHDNAINQAKSQVKISQLEDAVKKTCPDYTFEFRKITQDVKVIEVKTKSIPKKMPEVQKPPVSNIQPQEKVQEMQKETEAKKTETRQFSGEVRQMLDDYSGRIIEE